MPITEDSALRAVTVTLTREQIKYLKRNGMGRSKFMRQAVQAHIDGKWDYEFISCDEENK